jgi:pimeloyl-ACP methyl ester carboxylesterase
VLRQGSGEPLVLLHGILGSERMWSHVVPLLAQHYDVIAPTMLGHRGGRPATVRPTRMAHIVDDARRLLDELGLEQVHLAGNSLGGRVALELARLGRAQTVCALSPSGTWESGSADHRRATTSRCSTTPNSSPRRSSQQPQQTRTRTPHLLTRATAVSAVLLLNIDPRFHSGVFRTNP